MHKIPTLFVRDPEDMKHVLPEISLGCDWVLAGEGVATRKYDGTCVMFDGSNWWARREVKADKAPQAAFRPVESDPNTGKTVGWEPIESSSFFKFFKEAVGVNRSYPEGTYELCGPKINKNPEKFDEYKLIPHSEAETISLAFNSKQAFEELRGEIILLGRDGWEGVVWHHPDGRMAKLKARDFQ